MKKIYLTGCLLTLGIAAGAQQNYDSYTFGKLQPKAYHGPAIEYRPAANEATDRVELWAENFDGTGLTTGNGTWVTSGPEGNYFTLASQTTGSNGYGMQMTGQHLYWDSQTPIGDEGTGNFATTPVDGSITSPTIDLGMNTGAIIAFDLNAMFCCNSEPWSFNVSYDDGVSWSADIPFDLNMGANDQSNDIAEPIEYELVLTPYLDPTPGGNNDVKIKFNWLGIDANGAGQVSSHYYMGIDNISISDLPAYDISNEELWLADLQTNYEYTSLPANQATTLTVSSLVSNLGVGAPTNIALEVTVLDGSMAVVAGPVSGGTLSIGSLNSGETDTLTFATAIDVSAWSDDDYTIEAVITYDETDEVVANDELARTMKITQNSWGHINYEYSAIESISSFPETSRTGAYFAPETDVNLHGVDLYLLPSGGTAAQTDFDNPFTIYVDNRTTDTYVGSYEFTLVPAMTDNWYTFNLHQAEFIDGDTPVLLEAGNVYSIAFETFGGNVLWYQASIVDADFSGSFFYNGDGEWYWSGDEPYILLNLDETLTIDPSEKETFSIGQNKPNPFDNTSIINYSLEQANNVSIEFVDAAGKVVKEINQGNQAAGKYTIDLNSTDFAEGIYFYTFTIGEKQITKRMVVSK
ncbi:MAG: hypothetical protein BM555_04415 [Crocinitomix sp. MedPE-SWsnd]|nr:MAG: hypothetical protein BM555_04415 [Crocinitomix sp. MedPE-SWsnd]